MSGRDTINPANQNPARDHRVGAALIEKLSHLMPFITR